MKRVFLTIPIALPGDESKGNTDREVQCKIDPASILAWHPGYSWGTFIYLVTGQAFCCTLDVKQFEELLEKFEKAISSRIAKHITIV
jgi:hypothetical protein